MVPFPHGGDVRTAQARYGGAILDFSANLNPLGMPERVRRAAEEAVAGAVHYPDPYCRDLTAGLARRDGVKEGQVLCGNGAADLIFRLAVALRPRRALVTAPTFSEYEQALGVVDCAVERFPLTPEQRFDLPDAFPEALDPGLDLVFLCNPNNPTGRPVPPSLLERTLEVCARHSIGLVVDECFLELTDGGTALGLAGSLEQYPSLLLLRAFTKSYAIPGLRLGYCLSADSGLLEALRRCAQPWSVSAPAQAAGLAALEEPDWPTRARTLIQAERPALQAGLTALGLEVVPGAANYLLFRAPGITDLRERLVARGILIRSCANYQGLGPDAYRVAVRTGAENARLLDALREVL